MLIKPEDIKVESYSLRGNWGMSNGVKVIVTHVPTGIVAECEGKISAHRAKHLAYESLLKRLEHSTDYHKQIELF